MVSKVGRVRRATEVDQSEFFRRLKKTNKPPKLTQGTVPLTFSHH